MTSQLISLPETDKSSVGGGRLQISDRGHCQNLGRRQLGHAGDEDELVRPRVQFVGNVGDQVVEIAGRSDKPRQNLALILGSQREIQAVRTISDDVDEVVRIIRYPS
ncbi:hypothetical protein IYY11_00510 [Methylocystis sp. H62]|uniref:hypothetical protein n=1 Tax=Methylocystis sp. H62 TaxID=2785789 RepID=UPI0018C268E6|nr:hypothetical protein [Methylocystis sp. H62]MBG0791990.1 hypothetical protein [Methylocystis sp. H62]